MADEYPMFKDDSQSQYFCFHEFFEEILYVDFFQPKKDLRRSNLPFESTNQIIGMSIAYGKHAVEQKQTEAAIYFFEIAYGLTEDEELKEVIDHLNGAQEVEKENNSEE